MCPQNCLLWQQEQEEGNGVIWDYGWIPEFSDIFCLRQKSTAVRCGLSVQDCLQKHSELLGLSQPYGTAVDVNGKSKSRCWAPPPSEKWAQCWGFLKGFCSNSGGGGELRLVGLKSVV